MDGFKIKLPDNVLCEHLEGLSPKARNFEFIRLATNGLLMEKGAFNINTANNTINSENVNNITPDNVASTKHEDIQPKSPVDFGMDLTLL